MGLLGTNLDDAADVVAFERVLKELKNRLLMDPRQRELYRLRTAKRLLAEAAGRSGIFDPRGHLFGDPGWNILLGLYLLDAERGKVTVTDAANASCAPPTTGLRYLTSLISSGFVDREPDYSDRRKSFVSLSELGTEMMERFLDSTATW